MTRQNLTWREISRYSCQHVGLYLYGISLRLKDSGFHNLVLVNFSLPKAPNPKRMKSRGLFLESPETFRGYFGCHNSLCIFKRKRLEARNFAVILILQRTKTPALQNKQVVVLRMAFRARKVFGTFEKQAPGTLLFRSSHSLFSMKSSCVSRIDEQN